MFRKTEIELATWYVSVYFFLSSLLLAKYPQKKIERYSQKNDWVDECQGT